MNMSNFSIDIRVEFLTRKTPDINTRVTGRNFYEQKHCQSLTRLIIKRCVAYTKISTVVDLLFLKEYSSDIYLIRIKLEIQIIPS